MDLRISAMNGLFSPPRDPHMLDRLARAARNGHGPVTIPRQDLIDLLRHHGVDATKDPDDHHSSTS